MPQHARHSSNANIPPYPPHKSLEGFTHIKRYWDPKKQVYAAKILPGESYVSVHGEMIVTVLGSCVSACIRDRVLGVGGMNHFMLPANRSADVTSVLSDSGRYGNWAMEYLINEILKAGGKRANLEIKLFGGGKVLTNMSTMDVGKRNIEFVREYLKREGFFIAAEDLGDIYPRKVLFFPDTGAVKVRKLRKMANDTIVKRETEYAQEITRKPQEGDIELF